MSNARRDDVREPGWSKTDEDRRSPGQRGFRPDDSGWRCTLLNPFQPLRSDGVDAPSDHRDDGEQHHEHEVDHDRPRVVLVEGPRNSPRTPPPASCSTASSAMASAPSPTSPANANTSKRSSTSSSTATSDLPAGERGGGRLPGPLPTPAASRVTAAAWKAPLHRRGRAPRLTRGLRLGGHARAWISTRRNKEASRASSTCGSPGAR